MVSGEMVGFISFSPTYRAAPMLALLYTLIGEIYDSGEPGNNL